MRLLADENIPRAALSALAHAGHDIASIGKTAPGAPDEDVIARADAERRILLTFDKDFGELAFRAGLSPSSGVILVRFVPTSAEEVAALLTSALASRRDWAGHFVVIERDRVRLRPLPSVRQRAHGNDELKP